MWIRLLVSFSAYEATIIGLYQQQVVSDSMFRVLEQFPIVAIVMFTLYYVQRQQREDNRQSREWQRENDQLTRDWLDKMMENQREAYKENQVFLSTLLAQIDTKQNRMSDRIEILTQQLSVNTSTVSEIAKVDTIVSELIGKLEQK